MTRRSSTIGSAAPRSVDRGRLLHGVPMTLAVAPSFLVVMFSVPLRRLASIVRGLIDLDVPLVTDARGYESVAREVADTLARHGVDVRAAKPA